MNWRYWLTTKYEDEEGTDREVSFLANPSTLAVVLRAVIDTHTAECGDASGGEQLQEGDVLAVWNLDRLRRDLQDLLTFVDELGKQGISFVSLTQEWANTTSPMGTFLFQVFGGLAELERKRISERTKAGLAAARPHGRMGGRRRKLTDKGLRRSAELMREGRLPVREIARIVGVSSSTLYRYLTPDGARRGGTPTVSA